jgi:putative ABC transport system substrate-binding protein
MRRRAFISLLGGGILWPIVTGAQQSQETRRIGVLMNRAPDDPQGQARVAAFQQRLHAYPLALY